MFEMGKKAGDAGVSKTFPCIRAHPCNPWLKTLNSASLSLVQEPTEWRVSVPGKKSNHG
jgi:hypothetical protein